jgi:hypothetical protein
MEGERISRNNNHKSELSRNRLVTETPGIYMKTHVQ